VDHVAVLDVGKTNKKVLVFDDGLRIVAETYQSIPADESGPVHVEQVDATWDWFLEQLALLGPRHNIRAVSVTTHGATFVCVGRDGRRALPVVAYTTEPGEDFARRFYERCGDADTLHRTLGTPRLSALLSVAKGIAFVQERFPDEFSRVETILNLPQYFSYLLTGRAGAECTYTGCHTYLLDYRTLGWSSVADALGIRALLPAPIARPGDVLGPLAPDVAARTGLGRETIVTYGIHDSNASLLPFLIQHDEPFVLNSTGTWCVAMCPSQAPDLSDEERRRGVFLNCDAFGRPVRTAIFMGGNEWGTWGKVIQKATGTDAVPDYGAALYREVLRAADTFIFPGLVPGTGPFPRSSSRLHERGRTYTLREIEEGRARPACMSDAATAYAVLNCGLAVQTCEQLRSVGLRDGMPVYLEGGFRKNPDYQTLLASFFPHSPLVLTGMKEATAFGAALLARAALAGRTLKELRGDFQIAGEPARVTPLEGVAEYREAYVRLAEA